MKKIHIWLPGLIIFSLFFTSGKNREPASQKEIVGNYASLVFPQTCHLKRTNQKGKKSNCSASLIKPNKLITAAHCFEEESETIVTCACGEKNITAKVIDQSRHPRFVLSKKELSPYDIQILTTDTELNCTEEPFQLPTSMEHAKHLIENNLCYFSGAGLDHQNQYGNFHVVRAPKNFKYRQGGVPEDPTEWISYLNVTSARVVHLETYGPAPDPSKFSASEIGEFDRLEKLYKMQKQEVLDKIKSDDPEYSENAYTSGDSGGSLVCVDGDDKYLIGVLVNYRQDATLLNDPAIWNWLKELL